MVLSDSPGAVVQSVGCSELFEVSGVETGAAADATQSELGWEPDTGVGELERFCWGEPKALRSCQLVEEVLRCCPTRRSQGG